MALSVTHNPNTGSYSTSGSTNPSAISTGLLDYQPKATSFSAAPQYGQWSLGQNPATAGLNSVFNQATGGTINSFNTAANRLRERLDMQGKSLGAQATQANLGRGFGASGAVGRDLGRINQGQQFAYGQGLSELSNLFESQRQQGLQTALGAQSAIGSQFLTGEGLTQDFQKSLNSLLSGDWQSSEALKQKDQQSINDLLLSKHKAISEIGTNAKISQQQSEAAALGSFISQLLASINGGA